MRLIGITANREVGVQTLAMVAAGAAHPPAIAESPARFSEWLKASAAPRMRTVETNLTAIEKSVTQESASIQAGVSTPCETQNLVQSEAHVHTDAQEAAAAQVPGMQRTEPWALLQVAAQWRPVKESQDASPAAEAGKDCGSAVKQEHSAGAKETKRLLVLSDAAPASNTPDASLGIGVGAGTGLALVTQSAAVAAAATVGVETAPQPALDKQGTRAQMEGVATAGPAGLKGVASAAKKDGARNEKKAGEPAAVDAAAGPVAAGQGAALPAGVAERAHAAVLGVAPTASAATEAGSAGGGAGIPGLVYSSGFAPGIDAKGSGAEVESVAGAAAAGSTTAGPMNAGAPEHDEVKTLAATQNVLEIGVASASHGWLRVRAELGQAGEVTASVVAASAGAAETLRKEMPAMSAYLQSEQVGVSALMVNAAAETSGTQNGSPRDAAAQGGSMSPDAGPQEGHGRRDGGASAAGSGGGDEEAALAVSGARFGAEVLSGVAVLPAAVYAGASGSWLSVRV